MGEQSCDSQANSTGAMFSRLLALAWMFIRVVAVPGGGGPLSGILNGFSCHGDGHDHNASGACHAASALHPGVHSVDPTSFASFFPDVSADAHAHDQFLPDIEHANVVDNPVVGDVNHPALRRPRGNPVAFNEHHE